MVRRMQSKATPRRGGRCGVAVTGGWIRMKKSVARLGLHGHTFASMSDFAPSSRGVAAAPAWLKAAAFAVALQTGGIGCAAPLELGRPVLREFPPGKSRIGYLVATVG